MYELYLNEDITKGKKRKQVGQGIRDGTGQRPGEPVFNGHIEECDLVKETEMRLKEL